MSCCTRQKRIPNLRRRTQSCTPWYLAAPRHTWLLPPPARIGPARIHIGGAVVRARTIFVAVRVAIAEDDQSVHRTWISGLRCDQRGRCRINGARIVGPVAARCLHSGARVFRRTNSSACRNRQAGRSVESAASLVGRAVIAQIGRDLVSPGRPRRSCPRCSLRGRSVGRNCGTGCRARTYRRWPFSLQQEEK